MTLYADCNDQNVVVSLSSSSRDGWIECPDHVGLGWVHDNGSWIETAEVLLAARDVAIEKVDRDAESVRQQFITPGAGQAMVYLEKAQEAVEFAANPAPVATDYPLLKAEAEALNMPIADFATIILENRTNWKMVATQIEAIRTSTKAAIQTAGSSQEIENILSGLVWPQP